MWVFTKYGFFSAVCARRGSGGHGQPVDPDRIMVRGRVRGHLEALRDRFPDLLGGCEIHEFAGADYAFRIFVAKSAWSRALAGLAEETDYDNFKSEVARHQGRAGAAYEQALDEVWSVMNRLQHAVRRVPEKAGPDHEPIGSDAERIDFDRTFTAEEGAHLRRGGHGDMDTKWSYFHEDGRLSIYRGAGPCWARLKLEEGADGLEVDEAWASPSAFAAAGCEPIPDYLGDILESILRR